MQWVRSTWRGQPACGSGLARAAGGAGLAVLAALLVAGGILLHRARQPPPPVGAIVDLPRMETTAGELMPRGHSTLVLTFASAFDAESRQNLLWLSRLAPALQRRGVVVIGLSVDELPVLRGLHDQLALTFPLVGEGPGRGHHPLSDALGVFHGPPWDARAPVDASGLFDIDSQGRLKRSTVTGAGRSLVPWPLDDPS